MYLSPKAEKTNMKNIILSLLFIFPPVKAALQNLNGPMIKSTGINSQDRNGDTLLHHAVRQHDSYQVEYLVHNGADLTIVNNEGFTPLDIARDNCFWTEEYKENYLNNMDIYLFIFKNNFYRYNLYLQSISPTETIACDNELSDDTIEFSECDIDECVDCECCEQDGK